MEFCLRNKSLFSDVALRLDPPFCLVCLLISVLSDDVNILTNLFTSEALIWDKNILEVVLPTVSNLLPPFCFLFLLVLVNVNHSGTTEFDTVDVNISWRSDFKKILELIYISLEKNF